VTGIIGLAQAKVVGRAVTFVVERRVSCGTNVAEKEVSDSSGVLGTAVGAGGLGALIGIVGTILTALINRQAPLAAVVDARIKVLIDGYERRIEQLEHKVAKLEVKVDLLTKALDEVRARKGVLA
jgi:hypothetical protein